MDLKPLVNALGGRDHSLHEEPAVSYCGWLRNYHRDGGWASAYSCVSDSVIRHVDVVVSEYRYNEIEDLIRVDVLTWRSV
jgi:hypothetical protein